MCGCAPALDAGKIVQKKLTKINLLKEGRLINLLSSIKLAIVVVFSSWASFYKEFSAFSFDTED